MDTTSIVLKLGNREITLEEAIAEGIAQVINGKITIITNEAVELYLPSGMSLDRENIVLTENGEDLALTINYGNGQSILLTLQGMGTLIGTFNADGQEAAPFQVFQAAGDGNITIASLEQAAAPAAAGDDGGNQAPAQQTQQEDPALQPTTEPTVPVVLTPTPTTPTTEPTTPTTEPTTPTTEPTTPTTEPTFVLTSSFTGTLSGQIVEDASTTQIQGNAVATTNLGETLTFIPATIAGVFGTFTISSNGAWVYEINNSSPLTQALGQSVVANESFTIDTLEVAFSSSISISVVGTNDAAVITATDSSISEGDVSVSGTATAADVDNTDDTFTAVTDIASTYGTYSVTSAGVWTYTLDNTNATINALNVGQTETDTITITAIDGTTETVTITINGTNDAAVITATDSSISEGDVSVSGTATAADVDGTDNTFTAVTDIASTYGTYSVTSAGVWTYTLDNTNATINALNVGQTETDTITITAIDGTTETVTITINGTNDAPTADVEALIIEENDLTSATASEVSSYTISTDGTLEYATNLNTRGYADITEFEEQIKAALTAVFPSVDISDISVVSTLIEGDNYSLAITISNFTSTPYSDVTPSLMSTILGFTIPNENSLYTGTLAISDAEGDDYTTTLNPLLTTLSITTSNPLIASVIDSITTSPTALITSLKDILLNGNTTTSSKTYLLDDTKIALLMKAGLIYFDLDSDGNYTIYSPLFNTLGTSESISVNLGYTVTDGNDSTNASKTITINGTNDTPIAYEQTVSTELAMGETTYEGALPGAYYQTILNNVLLNTQGTPVAEIVDIDELQQAIVDSLMPSNFTLSLDSIEAFSLYAIMDGFEEDTNNAVASILAIFEANSSYSTVSNAESIIETYLFNYVQNGTTNSARITLANDLATELGITLTNEERSSIVDYSNTFRTSTFELPAELKTALLSIIGIEDPSNLVSTSQIMASLLGYAQGTATLDETVESILTLFKENLGVPSGEVDDYGLDIYEFPTQEQNDNADYLLSLVQNSNTLLSLRTLDPASIISFDSILGSLGIDLTNIEFSTIMEDVQTQLTAFMATVDLTGINSDTNFIENKLIEILDEVFVVLDDTLNTILNNTTTEELQAAILTNVIDGVMTELGYDIVAQAADAEYLEMRDLISITLEDLTVDLFADITIEAIKEAAITNILEQVGLDTALYDKTSRDEIASDMTEDLLLKLSMDKDILDKLSLTYELVEDSLVTTIFDTDGNDVTPVDLAATIVTINSDGTYSVTNEDFDNLNTLYEIKVEFNYVVNDGVELSNEQTVTLNIELEDASVSDGHIAGAIVFEDLNGNQTFDEGEKFTYTDEEGNFYLEDATGPLVSYGGTDISTGLPYEGILTAPAGSSVLSPLTTLIQTLVNNGMSLEDATSSVSSTFGIDSSIDLLNYDSYAIATSSESSEDEISAAVEVQAIAVQLATIMSQVASATDVDNQDTASLTAINTIATMISAGSSVSLTSTDSLTTILTNSGVSTSTVSNIASAISNINTSVSSATSASEIAAVQLVAETVEQDIEEDGDVDNILTSENISSQAQTTIVNAIPTLQIISLSSTDEDTAKTITFIATDSDGTVTTTGTASHGTVTVDELNGEITYTPTANFNGTDTILLTATDDDGAFITKIITITVNDINDTPTLEVVSTASVDEDGTKVISFTAADVDGTISTTAVIDDEAKGTVSINETTGEITYTPTANYNGVATITVTTTDNDGSSVVKTVEVTVNDINDAPTLEVVSTASVDEDGTKVISFTAADVDGTISTTAVIDDEAKGTVSINETTGEITYTPTANYNGVATITVTTTDNDGSSVVKTVEVTVNDINDAPTLEVVSTASVDEDGTKVISFTAADVDGTISTTAVIDDEAKGTVSINETTGEITYTPTANYNGVATITVTTTDNDGSSVVKTVEVTVNDINDAPTLEVVSTVSVDVNNTKVISFTAADVDGTISTTAVIDDEAKGTVSINETTGEITYVPTTDFEGTTTITVTTIDNDNTSVQKTILVTVSNSNAVPEIVVENSLTMNEDTSIELDISITDSDGNIESTVITASHGSAEIVNGKLVYTPTADYFGSDTITIEATDDRGATTTETISVTINNVNEVPVVTVSTTTELAEDLSITLDFNASDSDGTISTISASALHGTASFNGDYSQITYTPTTNFNGEDTITIEVTDNAGDTTTKTISVNVTSVNDLPVVTVIEDTASEVNGLTSVYSSTLTATDVEDFSFTFTVTNALVDNDKVIGLDIQLNSTTGEYDVIGNFDALALNETATVTFNYTATDSDNGESASKTVTIVVTGTNDTPIAIETSINSEISNETIIEGYLPGSVYSQFINYDTINPTQLITDYEASLVENFNLTTQNTTFDTSTMLNLTMTSLNITEEEVLVGLDSLINPLIEATQSVQELYENLPVSIKDSVLTNVGALDATAEALLDDAIDTLIDAIKTALAATNPEAVLAEASSAFATSLFDIYDSSIDLTNLENIESSVTTALNAVVSQANSLVSDIVSAIKEELSDTSTDHDAELSTAIATLIDALDNATTAEQEVLLTNFGNTISDIYDSPINIGDLTGAQTTFESGSDSLEALQTSLPSDIVDAIEAQIGDTSKTTEVTTAVNTLLAGLASNDSNALDTFTTALFTIYESVVTPTKLAGLQTIFTTNVATVTALENSLFDDIKAEVLDNMSSHTLSDEASLNAAIYTFISDMQSATTDAERATAAQDFGTAIGSSYTPNITANPYTDLATYNSQMQAYQDDISSAVSDSGTVLTTLATAAANLSQNIADDIESLIGVTLADDSSLVSSIDTLLTNIDAAPENTATLITAFGSTLFDVFDASVTPTDLTAIQASISTLQSTIENTYNQLILDVVSSIETSTGVTTHTTELTALIVSIADGTTSFEDFPEAVFALFEATVSITNLENIQLSVNSIVASLETAYNNLPTTIVTSIETEIGDTTHTADLTILVTSLLANLQADGADQEALLTGFATSLFDLYEASVTPAMLTLIQADITTAANSLESAVLGLPATMVDTLVETLNVDTTASSFNDDKSYLEGIALSLFASLATASSAQVIEGVAALIYETIERFDLSVEQVIIDNLSTEFIASLEALSTAISSFSKSTLLADINLVSTLGIDLSDLDSSAVTTAATSLQTYLAGITIDDLLTSSASIQDTIKSYIDTLVTGLENEVDSQITFTQSDLNDAILNLIMNEFSTELANYRSELQSMVGTLTDNEFSTFTSSLITSIIGTSTILSIDDISDSLLLNILESLGFESDIAGELAREELAGDIVESLIDRASMDADTVNSNLLTYGLDTSTDIVTTVTDENGVESTLTGTTVTINTDGSYSVENSAFSSIDSSSDISVTFNYFLTDELGSTGDSVPYTINIDVTDTQTFTDSDTETLDLATLLSNVTDLDEVNITSGDHILSSLSVDEYIALTDDDNQLKILGDAADTIELDNNWSQLMQSDGTTPYTDADGFNIYTATNNTNETVRLLIQEDINVSII